MSALPFGVAFSLILAASVCGLLTWHACHDRSKWCRKSFLYGGVVFTILDNVILEWPAIGPRFHQTVDDVTHLGDGFSPDWWNPQWSPWFMGGFVVIVALVVAHLAHVPAPWRWGKGGSTKGGKPAMAGGGR